MSTFLAKLKSEPAVVVATILGVLALFGVRLTDTDATAIQQLVVLLVPLLGGAVIRSQVTPEQTAAEREAAAAFEAYRQIQANDQ